MINWSSKWVGSKSPRKQRNYVSHAPLHLKKKFLAVHLSKELKKKYNKRNMTARKGDKVKVMRGEYKGKSGPIKKVYLKRSKISIDGIELTRKDGTKREVRFHPSNLMITDMILEDKKRKIILERKKQ